MTKITQSIVVDVALANGTSKGKQTIKNNKPVLNCEVNLIFNRSIHLREMQR